MKKDSSTESWGQKEITRVLKPGGKLLVSVVHPCFSAFSSNGSIAWQGDGLNRQVVVSNYYFPKEWEAPIKRDSDVTVIHRHRTLEDYVKMFIKYGLTIIDLHEPIPTEEQAAVAEDVAWMQKIPIFLFWELKK